MRDKTYEMVGMCIGLYLKNVQMGPQFFSEELFCLLTGLEFKPSVDLLYDHELKTKLAKVVINSFRFQFRVTQARQVKSKRPETK